MQTTGLDINVQATRDKLKEMNVQVVHASSDKKDATVFDIKTDGINNISQDYPDIPNTTARWITEDGYKKYYFADDQMATGWHTINGEKYFFNGKGHLQQDKWLQDFDDEGTLKSLYMDKDGKLQTSKWLQIDKHWYYVDSKGYRKESELAIINGKTYYFDEKGIMQTGTRTVNGATLVFDDTGALSNEVRASSWNKIGNKWYYLDENKKMTIGFKEIDGKLYYFNEAGEMGTYWQYTHQKWYYFSASGEMKRGWLNDAGKWYYLDPKNNDVMVTGLLHLNGHTYYLRTSGEKAPTGSMMSNEYLALNGYLYHFAESGFKDYEKNLNDIVNLAKSFVGNTPYVYGGEFPSGFDCSGLVKYCYGISQRTTYTQQTLGTHRYDVWNAPVGALYFYGTESAPDHVSISLGNGMTVQAMDPANGIKVIGISSYMPSYYIVIGQ